MRLDRLFDAELRFEETLREGPEADLIRTTERERLRALVEADMDVARTLHADDFQLINPGGGVLSKEEYLGGIASGEINYLIFESDSVIAVRLYGVAAVIRYRSRLKIVAGGHEIPLQRYWHTDSYEKRDGLWRAVWSQATKIHGDEVNEGRTRGPILAT